MSFYQKHNLSNFPYVWELRAREKLWDFSSRDLVAQRVERTVCPDEGEQDERGGADAARLRSRRGERGLGRQHGAGERQGRGERRRGLRAGVELAGLQLRRRARRDGGRKGRGLSHQGCESEDDAVHFRWLLHETFGDETI